MAEALQTSGGLTQEEAASVREHQKRGRFVDAITTLTRCIDRARSQAAPSDDARLQPLPPLSLLMQRARCYCRLHEWNACARDCDEILARSPADVAANSLRVECMMGLKQYDEAQQRIDTLIAQSHSASAAPYAPLQRLWKQLQEERQGRFDVAAMSAEAFSLVTPGPAAAGFSLDDLRRQRCIPCVRLGPHADYLHPSVECGVPMAGKGRGTRVRSASLNNSSNSSSAGSSDASSTSSSDDGASITPASSSSSSPGTLPRHTLVMSMKALSVHLRCDGVSKYDMLMRKLVDQPHLAEQVERLYGEAEGEPHRTKLLEQRGAVDAWRESSSGNTVHTAASVRARKSALVSTLSHNPFADSVGEEWSAAEVGGGALWFLPSLLNHSCVPNCSWQLIGDQLFIHSVREIQPGQELTIMYQHKYDIARLRSKLLRCWQFSCTCDLCSAWLALHPAIVQRERTLALTLDTQEQLFVQLQASHQRLEQIRSTSTALANSRCEELIKACIRMHAAIEAHQRYLNAHSQPLSPVHITLLQPRWRLSGMLRDLLLVLPPAHARLPSLLSLHLRACLSCISLTERWLPEDCVCVTVEALHLQVKFPAHATLTAQEQQARMQHCIADYLSAHGDTDSEAMRRHHAALMRQAGLEQLFERCLEEREQDA